MTKKFFLFISALLAITYSFNGVEAQCKNRYFAEAYNLRFIAGPVGLEGQQVPDPAAHIPPSGGKDVKTPAPFNFPGIISTQVLVSKAKGAGNQSTATASIASIELIPINIPPAPEFALISATGIEASATASCPSGALIGSTKIASLAVAGNNVLPVGDIDPGTIIGPLDVPNVGSVTLTLNEQDETADGLTVNAIHVEIDFTAPGFPDDIDLIINSATAGITCCTNAPVLSLKKSHRGNFVVGERGIYTLTVGNKGADSTSGEIKVVDTLPDGLTFVSAKGKGWTAEADGQKVTLTTTKSIASGDTSTIQLVVDVTEEAFPRVTNVARASGGGASNRPVARDVTRIFLTSLLPPKGFRGIQLSNEFATQTEYINRLKWKASPTDSVVAYLLFRNGRPIARITNHGHSFLYDDHNRREDERDTYKIIAVDRDGSQSDAEVIKVR